MICWKSESPGSTPRRFRISGNNRQQGPPTRTPLSTSRTCQPERTEILRPNPWPPTRTMGVRVGPRRSTSQNGDRGRTKYLRNVWDMGEAQMRSCQAKPLCWLDLRDVGSPKTLFSNFFSRPPSAVGLLFGRLEVDTGTRRPGSEQPIEP